MRHDLDYFLQIAPFELSDADKKVLSQTDEEYTPQRWEELKDAVDAGDLSLLRRTPSDMRNYLLWYNQILAHYESITKYVAQQRLGWNPHSGETSSLADKTPFVDPTSFKIVRNDWPYGLTSDITHMLVWSKAPIPVDEEGDPTAESRHLIETFVQKVFSNRIVSRPEYAEQIMWFKNRKRWQSVKGLEHIHVIVRGVDEALIEDWTGQTATEITARSWPASPNKGV